MRRGLSGLSHGQSARGPTRRLRTQTLSERGAVCQVSRAGAARFPSWPHSAAHQQGLSDCRWRTSGRRRSGHASPSFSAWRTRRRAYAGTRSHRRNGAATPASHCENDSDFAPSPAAARASPSAFPCARPPGCHHWLLAVSPSPETRRAPMSRHAPWPARKGATLSRSWCASAAWSAKRARPLLQRLPVGCARLAMPSRARHRCDSWHGVPARLSSQQGGLSSPSASRCRA